MRVDISVLPSDDKITWERRSTEDTRRLTLNLERCTGCGSCAMSCPQDAISMVAVGAESKSDIIIDIEKCVFCKTCSTICPFNAMELNVDGMTFGSLMTGEFSADFVDECERCLKCLDACPRDSLMFEIPGGMITKSRQGKIKRDEDLCIYCARCDAACCEEKIITVKKPLMGSIEVDQDLCDGCGTCIDACPTHNISFTEKEKMWDSVEPITIGEEVSSGVNILVKYHRESDEITFNDYCIYCGKCETVCPTGAIKVNIGGGTDGISGPWNEAIERRKSKKRTVPFKERKIDVDKCHACGDCVVACPVRGKVLKIVNGMVWLIDEEECQGCGVCVECCPGKAMKLYGPEISKKMLIKSVSAL